MENRYGFACEKAEQNCRERQPLRRTNKWVPPLRLTILALLHTLMTAALQGPSNPMKSHILMIVPSAAKMSGLPVTGQNPLRANHPLPTFS